jgi:hypothetical protein
MGRPTLQKDAELVLDADLLERELQLAEVQEQVLRLQLGRARRLLAVEQALARPAPRMFNPGWGVLTFVVAFVTSMVAATWGH